MTGIRVSRNRIAFLVAGVVLVVAIIVGLTSNGVATSPKTAVTPAASVLSPGYARSVGFSRPTAPPRSRRSPTRRAARPRSRPSTRTPPPRRRSSLICFIASRQHPPRRCWPHSASRSASTVPSRFQVNWGRRRSLQRARHPNTLWHGRWDPGWPSWRWIPTPQHRRVRRRHHRSPGHRPTCSSTQPLSRTHSIDDCRVTCPT